MTLRELWEGQKLSPTQLAAMAGISVTTLYAMNRKERVARRTIVAVCSELGITPQEYQKLEADKREK